MRPPLTRPTSRRLTIARLLRPAPRLALPLALAAAALAAAARAGAAQAPPPRWGLDVEAGVLRATRNDVQRPGREARAPGTPFSYTDELAAERTPYVRVRVDHRFAGARRNVVSLLAAPARVRSTGALARDVRFQGATFAGGVPIVGTYQFSSYRATFRRDVLWRGDARLGVGFTVALRDALTRLEGPTVAAGVTAVPGPRVRETFANRGLIPPLLSLDLDTRVAGPVRVAADFDGGVSPDGKGRAVDAGAALALGLGRGAAARVGYRVFEGGIDFATAYNLVLLQQFGAGLTLRF